MNYGINTQTDLSERREIEILEEIRRRKKKLGIGIKCSEKKKKSFTGRFWSKVRKLPGDECWEWQGSRLPSGYGIFSLMKIQIGAHRFCWWMLHGLPPEGLLICHKCDNPPCVNPSHLFLGTYLDNNRDRMLKGRTPAKINRKLTDDQVNEIKSTSYKHMKRQDIADKYGIHWGTVARLKNGWVYKT